MAKILIAGDYCPNQRVANLLNVGDFSFFYGVKDVVSSVDYSIVNLECPIVEGEVSPIVKCGPTLKTGRQVVDSIKYAGFNCVTLANNHFRDYGDLGCITTINELKKQNVDYVGGGATLQEAQKILYKEICGEKIAIINFCETEFSIAAKDRAGAAPMDVFDNYYQIIEARKNADFVIVIVHGGHEHYQLPSCRMKKLYRYYIELGADVIVNHHQHCYSGYEYYKGKLIVYGLGNFCFDEGINCNPNWYEGYVIIIDSKDGNISIVPYIQCKDEVVVNFNVSKEFRDVFFKKISEFNEIINDDIALGKCFEAMLKNRLNHTKTLFASYHNRYLNAAAYRGYIPHPIKSNEIAVLLDFIMCESHRDVVIENLKTIINCKNEKSL